MDAFVMSFRALHHTKAAKQISEATSLLELAQLEKEELEGGEHRPSLVDEFASRAKALAIGITEDQHLEVLSILDGKTGSKVLAALEGDSHSDDDTGPGETREGGESPSEAADHTASAAEASVRVGRMLKGETSAPRGRIVGPLVRSRQSDGTMKVAGMTTLRRRRE